jgi:hypothetical protein
MESKQRTASEILEEIKVVTKLFDKITNRLLRENKRFESDELSLAYLTHGAQGTSEPWTLRKECLLEWLQDYGSCVTDDEAEVIRKLAQLSEDYYRRWSEERRRGW